MAQTRWERLKQRGAMLLVTAAMAAVCVVFTMRSVRKLRIWLGDWPRVQATVASHSKIEESFDRRPLGSASVELRYQVDGREHRGTHTIDSDPLAEVREFLAEHPVGSTLAVFHDPADPGDCVLDRSPGIGTLLSPAVAVIAGLAAMILAYFTVRPDRSGRGP